MPPTCGIERSRFSSFFLWAPAIGLKISQRRDRGAAVCEPRVVVPRHLSKYAMAELFSIECSAILDTIFGGLGISLKSQIAVSG